jgi:hypothetical protein
VNIMKKNRALVVSLLSNYIELSLRRI